MNLQVACVRHGWEGASVSALRPSLFISRGFFTTTPFVLRSQFPMAFVDKAAFDALAKQVEKMSLMLEMLLSQRLCVCFEKFAQQLLREYEDSKKRRAWMEGCGTKEKEEK